MKNILKIYRKWTKKHPQTADSHFCTEGFSPVLRSGYGIGSMFQHGVDCLCCHR